MRKVLTTLMMLLICSLVMSPVVQAQQSPVDIAKQQNKYIDEKYNPKGMVVTADNGQIVYEYHKNKKVDPASTTKLMTMFLIYDDIKSGKIKMDDNVKITSRYAAMSQLPNLTTFPLQQGQTFTINQLLKQAALESSNAATLVLAEHIDGDSSKFTDRMNDKAKKLGMKDTYFTNPSGANNNLIKPFDPKSYKDETVSRTTAYDMALLANQILKVHPELLDITKLTSDTQKNIELHNTNTSLPNEVDGMKDVDGLKTGTSTQGYNLVLTAKRHHLRINTDIFNIQPYPDDTAKHARQQLANILTEQAFEKYEYRKVMTKGKHEIGDKKMIVEKDLYDLVPKDKSKYKLKISEDQRLYVDYNRDFIKGHHAPSVKVENYESPLKVFFHICLAIFGLILFAFLVMFGIKIYIKNN